MVSLLKALGMSLLVALFIGACASSPEPEARLDDDGLPRWVMAPPQADEMFYGVGMAKMSRQDASRRMAYARAREDIAFQMESQVAAAIVDYFQEAGAEDETQMLSFVETISRQVTETTLRDMDNVDLFIGPDGTFYALVAAPTQDFLDQAAAAFQRNEDAAFAQFQAQQALEFLDAQMRNNPTSAGN